MNFLDGNICKELRKVVNSSRIFHRDSQEKGNYNLICAVMDRVDSSVEYLNNHSHIPETEDDIMLFMVQACIINDAIKELMKQLQINDDSKDDKKYFKNICMSEPLNIDEMNCPTDIRFFEYVRSLIFAHPFETSRIQFLKNKKETHYSPFLISRSNGLSRNCIGIMVYSNQEPSTLSLYIPFETIQNYIKNRYEMLNLAKNELKQRIENKNKEWKKKKINRNQSDTQILQEVYDTLNERFCDTYEIEFCIKFLKYQSDNKKNYDAVQTIKDLIVFLIPKICDSIENLDYDELANIVDKIVHTYPQNAYQMFSYDNEKIFNCLSEDVSYIRQELGLFCARNFANQFAKKWVDIDAETMSYDEIKLLTITACYLELQAEKEINNEQN